MAVALEASWLHDAQALETLLAHGSSKAAHAPVLMRRPAGFAHQFCELDVISTDTTAAVSDSVCLQCMPGDVLYS